MELGAAIKGGILGAVVAAIGAALVLSPQGWRLEESFGLDALFRLRGARPPPDKVVIVSIDRNSSRFFDLPNDPSEWPRELHAQLVERLRAGGARVIVFDMNFDRDRVAAGDKAFARAVATAGNVVLFEYLRRDVLGAAASSGGIQLEQRVPPIAILADAAAGSAPFPLPKVPAKVRQGWLFKPEVGEAPTLPSAVLQRYWLQDYPALRNRVAAAANRPAALPLTPDPPVSARALDEAMRALRRTLAYRPGLAQRLHDSLARERELDAATRVRLQTLVDVYSGPHSRYLNFYGPPHTLVTLPYHVVLRTASDSALRQRLQDTAVFVGFSERFQPEQQDGFYTVYSQRSGLDISGVEIAATAFANLLHHQWVTPLSRYAQAGLLVALGIGLALLLRAGPMLAAVALSLTVGGAYLLLSVLAFERWNLWLPLVTPLALQLPVAVAGTVLWRYFDLQRERRNIRRAFGYHLPAPVIDRLARGLERVGPSTQALYGVCLASDAERYSSVSESLPATEVHALLNRYYELLFTPVRRHGGVISDVVGDAMLAIWVAPRADPSLCRSACEAALAIMAAVERSRSGHDADAMPTRIGIHCGAIALGHVGAVDHFEYRAVGDIVNTATRIEGLGKELGSRLLVSAEVLATQDGLLSRELGSFTLKGKREPVTVHELLGTAHDPRAAELRERSARFAAALAQFRARDLRAAATAFAQYERRFGPDGPARYYLARIDAQRQEAPGVRPPAR